MSDKKASLEIDGKTIDLPVYSGTIGPDVIEVSALTGNGYFTYDPGFVSTAACESKITYIDGNQGVLLHRGYPIEQLAEHSDYLETCYLLLCGELPTQAQKDDFVKLIGRHPWRSCAAWSVPYQLFTTTHWTSMTRNTVRFQRFA